MYYAALLRSKPHDRLNPLCNAFIFMRAWLVSRWKVSSVGALQRAGRPDHELQHGAQYIRGRQNPALFMAVAYTGRFVR